MPTVYKKDSFPVTFQLQDWQDATLENSWANVGSPYYDAGYYKDPFGIVRLRGRVYSGSSGTVALTLPTGFRPNATIKLPAEDSGSVTSVTINSSGQVILTTSGGSPEISLESITFLAEA